ncbi:MAG TPA: SGNH/GDSL hydrolase family protein [Solirubrobacteraceae bacterium]|nr:SGNH/GDSL hydrolase family protein [Solirubrobacteraceae bacterium]
MRLTAALVACAALMLGFVPGARAAHYYLALGDSLAAGFQAPPAKPHAGYVDDLYAPALRRQRDLRLVNVACLGATSTTLMSGDLCSATAGPQLRRAIRFLRRHRGNVSLVTLDIGGNDIGAACGTGLSVTIRCARSALVTTGTNVSKIAQQLRAAAGRRTPIVAMNYYDPGLAFWLQPSSRAVVPETLSIVDSLNRTLARAYRSGDVAVADVATAFAIHDLRRRTTLAGHGRVPVAVANVCRYTGACLSPQNNHGTALGYRVISRAFLDALSKVGEHLRGRIAA